MAKSKINWENEKENLIRMIFIEKIPYDAISRKYGFISDSPIRDAAKKLGIKLPNRQLEWAKINKNKKECYELKNKLKSTELVPIEYSSTVIKIRYGTRNNIHYYVPELGRFIPEKSLEKSLSKLNIKLYEWQCRWILRLPLSYIGTDIWAKKVIEFFYKDKLYYTKIYIFNNLLKNPEFVFTSLMVKEDIVSTLSDKEFMIKLDISSFPKEIRYESEPFYVKDLNGNIFPTAYQFLKRGTDPTISGSRKKTNEQFIRESKKKFGNKFTYLSEYVKDFVPIKIKCNDCGTVFEILPGVHLASPTGGCKTCNNNKMIKSRSFTKEKFQRKIDEIYGKGKYTCISEYKNAKTIVTIKDEESGEIFQQDPENILYHKIVLKFKDGKKSTGEFLTEKWLRSKNIEYENNVYVPEIEGRNINSKVNIDFIIHYLNRTIWIEYNGKQHYDPFSKFHNFDLKEFEKQQKRDQNVRDYCKRNNIPLIEIPYTIGSWKRISEFLDKVILQGVDPNILVDYQSLYKN